MKHDLRITLFLVFFFLLAQLIGLLLINIAMPELTMADGKPTLVYEDTSLGPRPELTGLGAFFYVIVGVALGTLLVMLIIKLGKIKIWKAWFFLAVFFSISLALGVVIESKALVWLLALVLSLLKLYKPNVIVHNLTELLMYSGIAVFLVPAFNGSIFWAVLLLIVIAIYDFIAVYKSKHMVKMARFQAESQVFAGLFVPYTPKDALKSPNVSIPKASKRALAPPRPTKSAVLGGGDIAFPMIFTGVVMEHLVLGGVSKAAALSHSLVITAFVTASLAMLLFLAQKDKFYPAMPFISAGCLLGYAITLLF